MFTCHRGGGVAIGDLFDQADERVSPSASSPPSASEINRPEMPKLGELVEVVDRELAVTIGVGRSFAERSSGEFANLFNQLS